ncbi:MAG: hypothetical protein J6L89_03995 [Clostridia bacterium]|nr:hypothetical protein [Clostridia bacterium]
MTNKSRLFGYIFMAVITIVGLSLFIYQVVNHTVVEWRLIITALFLVFNLIISIKGIIDCKKALAGSDKNDK